MKTVLLIAAIIALFPVLAYADVNDYDRQGDEFLREGRYHEAIDCYWLSVRTDPIQPYPYSRLAVAYVSIGMRNEAKIMESRSKALEHHQEWIRKGDSYYSAESYVEATVAYERALEYFPESYIACEKLALTYNKTGQKEKSFDMYKKAHELRTAMKTRAVMEGNENAPPEETIEKLRREWEFSREDEILKRRYETDAGYALMLSMPLTSGNNNLLNSLVFVPPLEGAGTVTKQSVYVTTGLDVSLGSFSNNGSWSVFYDERLLEPSISVKYGLLENLEARFYISMPTLADLTDGQGIVIDSSTVSYVPDAKRSWGVGDFVPSLKYQIYEAADGVSGLSVAAAFKMPLADKYNFVSSGGPDMSVNIIGSQKYGQSVYHFNLGYTMTGAPTIFVDDLTIDNVVSFGIGYVLNMTEDFSFNLQLEGNTNAFSVIGGYDGSPMTFMAGGKFHAKYFLVEFGVGTGIGEVASDFTAVLGITTKF